MIYNITLFPSRISKKLCIRWFFFKNQNRWNFLIVIHVFVRTILSWIIGSVTLSTTSISLLLLISKTKSTQTGHILKYENLKLCLKSTCKESSTLYVDRLWWHLPTSSKLQVARYMYKRNIQKLNFLKAKTVTVGSYVVKDSVN